MQKISDVPTHTNTVLQCRPKSVMKMNVLIMAQTSTVTYKTD
ncbi:hypothetical protein [uncultured Methanobrevibacter sp.]|nr:hypothetical protein [uncultured Methanobrevibacter sp.]